MKKILVPVDFSECSRYALELAIYFARETNAGLILLNVLDVPGLESTNYEGRWESEYQGGSKQTPYTLKLLEVTGGRMKQFVSEFDLEGIALADTIEIGSVSSMVIDSVEKNKVDMVVMGTHGTSGLNEYFIGSNAEKVVRMSKVPVITLQARLQVADVNKIVFASDFLAEASEVFPVVKKVADVFGAKVNLLKVNTPTTFESSRKSGETIVKFMKKNGLDLEYSVYNADTKEEGIIQFCDEANADLIALGTHGRSGLSRFFDASVAEGIVNHSFLPVLTVNIHK